VIRGKPKLWVPLKETPKKLGFKKLTPKRYVAEIGDLFSRNRAGKQPLLFANMNVSSKEAKRGPPYRVRLSALRRGGDGGTGVQVSVPLFAGVDTVSLTKKLNIRKIIQDEAQALPQLYLKHLEAE
jgi:hypothetical protein